MFETEFIPSQEGVLHVNNGVINLDNGSKTGSGKEGIIGKMTDKKRRYKMQILKEHLMIK